MSEIGMLASGSMNVNVALCATVMSIVILVCHECHKALIYKLGHQLYIRKAASILHQCNPSTPSRRLTDPQSGYLCQFTCEMRLCETQ